MASSSSTNESTSSSSSSSPPPYLSPLLQGVNITRLPDSVTDLVTCFEHEIRVIEDELDRCYNNDDDNSHNIESLEDAIDDGFMCVDLRVLERKLEVWHRLFSPAFDSSNTGDGDGDGDSHCNFTVTPFFAVKCNPDPVVVEWLARSASRLNLPLGFDCASIAEIELAKKHVERYALNGVTGNGRGSNHKLNRSCSVPTTRIVYANPQRAESDVMRALELFATPHDAATTTTAAAAAVSSSRKDLWLTLDGVEEVYKIAIAKEKFLLKHKDDDALVMPLIKIILRIWVPDGHSQVPLGEKFGMKLDHIGAVMEACLEHGIDAREIIGISFHCGSGCESVETYLEALAMGQKALAAMDNTLSASANINHQRCWLLDIGGGFPGVDGLYGDEGRFAVAPSSTTAGGLATTSIATTSTLTPTLAKTVVEEKKEGDDTILIEPTKQQTTVADIAVAVRPVLQSFAAASNIDGDGASGKGEEDSNPPLTLIAEPGRYFVEGAFALASRIYQKQIQRAGSTSSSISSSNSDGNDKGDIRVYRIPHGVQGVFKDVILCGESFVPQPLQMRQNLEEGTPGVCETEDTEAETKIKTETETALTNLPSQKLYLSRVLGPSGDDAEDVVCESCWLPELTVGDWLVFDRMGAYTLSIASRAGRPVMRYVLGGSEWSEDTKHEA